MIPPWENGHTLWARACFDPVTLLAGATALSATVGAVGAIASGQAQQRAYDYSAAVDRNNAIQAQDATNAQAVSSDQKTQSLIGEQKAAYAASGVDVNTGTPVDVMSDTAARGRLNALTLRYGGRVDALRDTDAATLATAQGQDAATASYFTAGNTLLTGYTKYQSASGTGSG